MADTERTGAASDQSAPVGSLGEEAAKLLRALTSEAGRREPVAGVADDPHVCTTAWCPVCQVVGFVKEHPEVVEQVTDAAVQMAKSVRDLLEVASPPSDESHER